MSQRADYVMCLCQCVGTLVMKTVIKMPRNVLVQLRKGPPVQILLNCHRYDVISDCVSTCQCCVQAVTSKGIFGVELASLIPPNTIKVPQILERCLNHIEVKGQQLFLVVSSKITDSFPQDYLYREFTASLLQLRIRRYSKKPQRMVCLVVVMSAVVTM